jgi:hypothetical protein
MPSFATVVATTGSSQAIACTILFCMPAPILSGSTATEARHSQSYTSGTSPVTRTRPGRASARTLRCGLRPTIQNWAPGTSRSTRGKMSRANQVAAATLV